MSGITMALNITKRLDKKNSSVSDKTEIPETKFSSLHKECISPLTNESYYSFVGKYWNCIRNKMTQSVQKKDNVIQNNTEKQQLCLWTMEHQFLFTD